jgi:hypothetical protein
MSYATSDDLVIDLSAGALPEGPAPPCQDAGPRYSGAPHALHWAALHDRSRHVAVRRLGLDDDGRYDPNALLRHLPAPAVAICRKSICVVTRATRRLTPLTRKKTQSPPK